jgi:hypothetical protein
VYEVTAPRVLVILALYAALLMVIRLVKPRIEPFERRSRWGGRSPTAPTRSSRCSRCGWRPWRIPRLAVV